MIRNKFKKLIALASSVAIVSSFMVPVTHAASGEVYYDENFDSLEEKVLVKVSSDSSQSYTGEGFEMQCGSRGSADGNAFEIAYSGGKLAAAKERYSDADRYGRIYLQNVPADADLLYSSFDFSVTKAEGIVISDIDNVALMSGGENTETLGVGTLGGIESGKEYTLELVNAADENILTITDKTSDEVIYRDNTTVEKLSRIDIRNGITYIDNLYIQECNESDFITVNVNKVADGDIINTTAINNVVAGTDYQILDDMLGNYVDEATGTEYIYVSGSTKLTNVSADNNTIELQYRAIRLIDLPVKYVITDAEGKETVIKEKTVRVEEGESYTETELDPILYNDLQYVPVDGEHKADNVSEGSELKIPCEIMDGAVYYEENFDGLTEQVLVKVATTVSNLANYSDENFEIACGVRDPQDGTSANDAFEIAFRNDRIESQYTRFADSGRFGRIALKNVPATVGTPYYSSVDFYTNNSSALAFSDDNTTGVSNNATPGNVETVGVGNPAGIAADTWYTATFENTGAGMTFTITEKDSGEVIHSASTAVTKLSRIDILNGVTYLDNITSKILSSNDIIDSAVEAFDLTEGNENVVAAENGYSVSGGFTVPTTFAAYPQMTLSWASLESPEGADDWTDSKDITVDAEGKVTVGTTSAEKDYKLVLTIKCPVAGKENPTVRTVEYTLIPLTQEETVKQAVEMLKIPQGGTNDGSSAYEPTGDFKVDTNIGAANIAWASSSEALVVNGGNITLMPTAAETVTLTATVTCGTASGKKEFTIDLTNYYNNTVKKPVDDAVADKTVNPNDDRTGSYGTPDAAEGKFALDTFTAENPLSFDLYLPSSVSGNSNLKQTWSVTGDGLDVDGEVAALAVDNTEANSAKITKTVAFVKNGTTLYSASADYDVTVQFDPAAVDEMTDKWAETSGEEDVKSTFFYAYQLKLDAASEENFADMPDEGTDISTSGISNLNYGGEDSVFGSLIEWTSSQSTYASVSKSNKKVTVNRSSFSGTKDITLTATIYIEGYSKNETRAFKYEITGTKSSSSSGGGSGRPSTGGGGTIPVPVVTPTPAPVVTPTPADEAFDDIEGVESWAGDAIRALYSEGVISGKGDKKFAPYDNVTRGEFAKMIVGAFNLSEMPDEYRGFTDVPSGHWCFSYVEVAANAGVVNGYEDGSFGIDDYITRQDMAVMVVRAAEAAGVEIADAGSSADFGDSASIADYASAAVESLVKAGIINGIDGNFEPASNANRAQAAKILANFI